MRACRAALLLYLVAQPACDRGESSFVLGLGDAGAPSARHESACRAWAKTLCDHRRRCCEADAGTSCPVFVALRWVSDEQCISRTLVDCELAADDSTVFFDDDKVAACTLSSDCSFWGSRPPCLPAGKAPAGTACLRSESCQSGFCEGRFDTTTGQPLLCGTCRSIACMTCGAKEACRSVDGGIACIHVAELGEPCTAASDCRSGYCQRTADSQGVCRGGAGPGEACGQGALPFCSDFNSFCDGTGHCRPYLTAGYGQACGSLGDPNSDRICIGAGTCVAPSYVCIPPVADGALCDEEQGLGCLPPAQCLNNQCVFPNAADCAN